MICVFNFSSLRTHMDIIALSVYTIIQIGLLRIIAITVRREVNDAEKHKKNLSGPVFFTRTCTLLCTCDEFPRPNLPTI